MYFGPPSKWDFVFFVVIPVIGTLATFAGLIALIVWLIAHVRFI